MRLALTVLAFVLVPLGGAAVEPAGVMTAPRAVHTATLLLSGLVLIAGGCTLDGCESDERSATTELYDPERGSFSPGPQLVRSRLGHAAVRLADGDVLFAGGWSAEGTAPTATAELFEPEREAFSRIASMSIPRGGFTATRLRDGRVLVAGGFDGERPLASAELYDPRTRRFVATGGLRTPRDGHAAALLRDGRVLVVGGRGQSGVVLASMEIYDPGTGRFSRAGTLRAPRHKLAVAGLRGGNVLVVGGSDARDFRGRYSTAELYDPRRKRSLRLVSMTEPRFKLGDAVVRLRSGSVLVAGGGQSVEVYDPRNSRFRGAGRIGTPLSFSTATLLPDGSVLVAGGYDDRIAVTRRVWTFRG